MINSRRAVEALKEYAAECPITAERLAPFFAAVDSGNVNRMIEHRNEVYQFAACGHGIDCLYDQLEALSWLAHA